MCSTGPEPRSPHVRARMRRQPRAGTQPEMALRRALHHLGYRYRVGYRVPGAPRRSIDMAFPGRRVAVMVDGCFWHACPTHGVSPKNNSVWWAEKLAKNVERDRSTDEILMSQGWTVVRVWEHTETEIAVESVELALAVAACGTTA